MWSCATCRTTTTSGSAAERLWLARERQTRIRVDDDRLTPEEATIKTVRSVTSAFRAACVGARPSPVPAPPTAAAMHRPTFELSGRSALNDLW